MEGGQIRDLSPDYSLSCSPDNPLDVFDADFLARLLVVVEPFTFGQVDVRELGF